MELVYSGGFMGMAGLDQFGQTRMQIGLSDHMFHYPVESGASFTAPETILSFSGEGLSGLSRQLHDCIRSHVVRGYWRDRVRPVLLNSWEGCYLTFDVEKILNLAREAKGLNLDLFVLDDGWFGKRDSDNSGLGDWFVNEKKIGDLHRLVGQIHDMGGQQSFPGAPGLGARDSRKKAGAGTQPAGAGLLAQGSSGCHL